MKRLLVVAALALAAVACAEEPDATTAWPFVGSDQAHTKYSVAEEITAANVGELEIVWKWEPNEAPWRSTARARDPSRPPQSWLTAISTSPRCTREWWRSMPRRASNSGRSIQEPTRADRSAPGPPASSTGASPTGAMEDDKRIFLNSRDRLYAIDAETGDPDAEFGEGGSVSLTEGHGREVTRFEFDQTSPPVVFEDLVIVGSRIPDGVQREFDPPGTVQAFDTRTGETALGVLHHPAIERRLRGGYMGGRVLALHRPRKRVGADVARCRAGPAIRADEHAEQRLLGRTQKGSEPVCRVIGVPRRPHRRTEVALPDGTPRLVGL